MASRLCTSFSLPLTSASCSSASASSSKREAVVLRACCCNSASSSSSSSSSSSPRSVPFTVVASCHGNSAKSKSQSLSGVGLPPRPGKEFVLAPATAINYRPKRETCVFAAAAGGAVVGTEELPGKLQEIVKLFQQVEHPRAKYEQLLHYAKRLKPLAKEFCTKENKVEGCVSQVWVRPSLDSEEGTISFEADSDSVLTKGLAALLVEGLSGAKVADVLKLSPDFIQMLGLNQSLTPSRSNGFLNMLKLMQKKTLQMYMEAEAGKSSLATAAASAVNKSQNGAKTQGSASDSSSRGSSEMSSNNANLSPVEVPKQRSKKASIERKLQEALSPTVLVVDDVSHQHAGHAGVHKGATETHFNVTIVSDKFSATSLIKRHRLVYGLLDDELKNGVHALSLDTKAPSERPS